MFSSKYPTQPSTEHVRNCTLLFVPGFMNGLLPGRALEHSFPLLEKDTGELIGLHLQIHKGQFLQFIMLRGMALTSWDVQE